MKTSLPSPIKYHALKNLFLILFICTSAAYSQNQCLNLFHSMKIPEVTPGAKFIIPNEEHPKLLKEKLKDVIQESTAYISVGTERGFMMASLPQNKVEKLILIDHEPSIVLFNKINIALLKIAESRESYLNFRLHADKMTINHHSRHALLTPEEHELLSSSEVISWWITQARQSAQWSKFITQPEFNPQHEFQDTNYLFDDTLFAKISSLAKTNKITAQEGDLADSNLLKQLNISESTQHTVFDISNAWDYITQEQQTQLNTNLINNKFKTTIVFSYQTFQVGQPTFNFNVLTLSQNNPNDFFSLIRIMKLAQKPNLNMRYNRFDRD